MSNNDRTNEATVSETPTSNTSRDARKGISRNRLVNHQRLKDTFREGRAPVRDSRRD